VATRASSASTSRRGSTCRASLRASAILAGGGHQDGWAFSYPEPARVASRHRLSGGPVLRLHARRASEPERRADPLGSCTTLLDRYGPIRSTCASRAASWSFVLRGLRPLGTGCAWQTAGSTNTVAPPPPPPLGAPSLSFRRFSELLPALPVWSASVTGPRREPSARPGRSSASAPASQLKAERACAAACASIHFELWRPDLSAPCRLRGSLQLGDHTFAVGEVSR